MPTYVVLSRLTPEGRRSVPKRFGHQSAIQREVEAAQGRLIAQFALIGEYDFCSIVSLPDNGAAQMLGAGHGDMRGVKRVVLPAIDLPLFIRLCQQTTETTGPHRWQTWWPCRLFRQALFPYLHTSWARRYFEPLQVVGRELVRDLRGPAIFIANHASHLDLAAFMQAVPWRYRAHIYFGSAADRWFLKGRKELRKQGWWRSLAYGSFPIHRGGGSATLQYAEELLQRGAAVGIFPEGTRTTTGRIGKFKPGVAILALKVGVPVVPLYMDGLDKLMPKGRQDAHKGPVRVQIGAPLRFPLGTDVSEATRILRHAMEDLRRECRDLRHAEAAREAA